MAGKNRRSGGSNAWWGMVWTLLTMASWWVAVVELSYYMLLEERVVIVLFTSMAWGIVLIAYHWWTEPVLNYSRQVRRRKPKLPVLGRDGKGRWRNIPVTESGKAVGQ